MKLKQFIQQETVLTAATALLFALAACTQDELADDSRLSKEEYPIDVRFK